MKAPPSSVDKVCICLDGIQYQCLNSGLWFVEPRVEQMVMPTWLEDCLDLGVVASSGLYIIMSKVLIGQKEW